MSTSTAPAQMLEVLRPLVAAIVEQAGFKDPKASAQAIERLARHGAFVAFFPEGAPDRDDIEMTSYIWGACYNEMLAREPSNGSSNKELELDASDLLQDIEQAMEGAIGLIQWAANSLSSDDYLDGLPKRMQSSK